MVLRGGEEADIHLSRIYLGGGGERSTPTFGQIFFATPENFTIKLRMQGTHRDTFWKSIGSSMTTSSMTSA